MNQGIRIDRLGWANIKLRTPNGNIPIRAKIFGHFGRHEARDTKLEVDAWSVTHVPTGRCFGWYFKSPRQADSFMEDVAELLDAEGVNMDIEDWESAYALVRVYYSLILNMAAKRGALPNTASRERFPGE